MNKVYSVVLILVLMEDTLREQRNTRTTRLHFVLILVLMEDTLRVTIPVLLKCANLRLNPCFNGRYS